MKLLRQFLQEPAGTFRSSWARNIHRELQIAAEAAIKTPVTVTAEDGEDARDPLGDVEAVEDLPEETPEVWDDRWTEEIPEIQSVWQGGKKRVIPPIRKPAIVKNWFGLQSSSDDSDTDTETEGNGWSAVDRKRRGEERRRRTAEKRDALKKECAGRAANMFSIGPITYGSIDYFYREGQTFNEAKISAVKEFFQV